MSGGVQRVVIDAVPPSLNKMGSRGASRGATLAYNKTKRDWEGWIRLEMLQRKVPRKLKFCEVSALLRFPVKRRRDEGNYRWFLEKACGDSLQIFGYLPDDTPEFFIFRRVLFAEAKGPHCTVLVLTYEEADPE